MGSVAVLETDFEAGKSFVVPMLCRYFKEKGKRVTPFKGLSITTQIVNPPRISLAQVVQARVAGLEPDHKMNPVVLVPSKGRVQVYLEGEKLGTYRMGEINREIERLREVIKRNVKGLTSEYDVVCIEGIGSLSPSTGLGVLGHLMEIGNWCAVEATDASVVLCSRELEGLRQFLQRLPAENQKRVKVALTNRLEILQTVREWGYGEREVKVLAAVFRMFYRKPNKLKFLGIFPEFPELSDLPPLDSPTGKHPIPVDKWVKAIEELWERAKKYVRWKKLEKLL